MKKLATCQIRNLLSAFLLLGVRYRKSKLDIACRAPVPFLAGVVLSITLGSLFALSAPSFARPLDKLTVAAIDDVVAGDEGWIITIDDVAADAGGWITAIDAVAASAGGGIAAYAAEAGSGFAAFGDFTSEVGGGIAAFGKVEEDLANIAVGVEASIGNFTAGVGFEFDSATDDSESIDDDISVVITEPEKETSRGDNFNTAIGIGRVFDKNGRELFPEDFNIGNPTANPEDESPSNGKTPTNKPKEHTIDFPPDDSQENIMVDDENWSDIEYEYTYADFLSLSKYSSSALGIIQGGEGEVTHYERDYLQESSIRGSRTCVYEHDSKDGDHGRDYESCSVVNGGPSLYHPTAETTVIRDYDIITSGEIINPPLVHPRRIVDKVGVYVRLETGYRGNGDLNLTNNARISDVNFGIYAFFDTRGDFNITNNGEVWGVKKHGILARRISTGSINVTLSEDIKILNDGVFSDVYMVGGNEHNLVLKDGIVLTDVSFGVVDDERFFDPSLDAPWFEPGLESKWDVDSGNNQQETFEGFADYGAYRYVLDHEVVEGANVWSFYRDGLSYEAAVMSDELKDLAVIGVDIGSVPRDNGGFWAHQNSLRSLDDSVHFGFNTPAIDFMGGGLFVSNGIAPNLSASLMEGVSMSNSIGLDYHFDAMGFSVSPQMEVAWRRFDFDDFMGHGNTGRVSLEDGDVLMGRLGLLFDGEYFYGGVNIHTAIDGKTALNVSGVSIANEQDDLSIDGLLGFSYDLSENYWTYGEIFVSSRDGDEKVRASLGVRVEF